MFGIGGDVKSDLPFPMWISDSVEVRHRGQMESHMSALDCQPIGLTSMRPTIRQTDDPPGQGTGR